MEVSARVDRALRVVSLLFVVSSLSYFGWRLQQGFAQEEAYTGFTAGQQILVPNSLYRQSPYTVLLFARSSCPTCQATASSMATLRSRIGQERPSVRMVLVSPHDAAGEELALGRAIGLASADIVSLVAPQVRKVPTIVVVSREGSILWSSFAAVDQERAAPLFDRVISVLPGTTGGSTIGRK